MGQVIRVTAFTGIIVLLAGVTQESFRPLPPLASAARRAVQPPEPPRATVTVPEYRARTATVHVAAGGDLQQALDAAQPGDVITLEPGATYRGPFHLRRKSGDDWIVIASASDALPAPGARVEPSDAGAMPKLVSTDDPVFVAEPGAHHYRLVGLEIAPVEGEYLNTLVQLGDAERSTDEQPHHIIIDRSYLHGDPRRGARRGVALNSRHTAVIDSYLSDFKEVAADSQALAGWNGAGPFRISGNYLEAAGENVMFGGADPSIPGLVPADIEIVRNHFAKPLRWKKDDPSFEGTDWAVKNLFELKNARRVRVEGNVFEYNWPHAQNGFAILFTVRNQDGAAPWSQVEDVTFVNNVVRHVGAGINILGHDDIHRSRQTRRLLIANNLFVDVGGAWGNGRLFQLLDGTAGVRIEHNTAFHSGSVIFGGDHAPHTGFVFENNVVQHNEHGITGSGTNAGIQTLDRYFPDARVLGNVLVGAPRGDYPRGNAFPPTLDELGVHPDEGGRVALSLAAPYARAGTDGRAPGVDLDALIAAVDGVADLDLGLSAANSPVPVSELSASGFQLSGLLLPSGLRGAALEVGSAVVFWTALLLLAYVYAGYPLLTALRAALRPKPRVRAPVEPTVSIVVVAYNEAHRIAARIENLLALDYPRDRLEIVIASDGSSDDTAAAASLFQGAGVKVWPFTARRGKTAVLNAVVPALQGELVLFADARQRFEPGTLRALVENFADPQVGAVSGELVLTSGDSTAAAAQGTAFYWRYEKFIRSNEGRADSTVGATGAIYAIRRALFEPIPDDTILDDVLIPLRIVKQGYRVVFEPAARAFDTASATARQEFARKARTMAGNFQLFAREGWLLNPWRNRLWFETVSHKGLRLTLPLLHAAVLLAPLALLESGFFRLALAGQVAFYAAALLGHFQQGARRRLVVFSVPCAICLLSWATIVGFARFVTRRQQVTWDRVPPTSVHPV